MDNNFYEYRREPRPRKEEKPKNIMAKVIVVQLVFSLLISGVVFLLYRNDNDLYQGIKSFYAEISEKDIAVSEILDVFKNVTKSAFAPSIIEEKTEDGIGETTTKTGEKADFSPVFLTVNFQNPIEIGNITSKFGYRVSPITNEYSLHSGLDIAAPENTEIYASYDGVVIKAEYNEINGNYVVIQHSEHLKTTCNHCNKLLVKEGKKVKKGEKIALVGATGYATGNHLHFEIILNNKYINPLWVLNYEV